jgi:hypothetical protein
LADDEEEEGFAPEEDDIGVASKQASEQSLEKKKRMGDGKSEASERRGSQCTLCYVRGTDTGNEG